MQTPDNEKQETNANNATEQQPLNPGNNNQNRILSQQEQELYGQSIPCAGASSFIITMLIGLAFYYLSTTEEKYGGPDCKKLRSDSLIYGYVLIIGGALGTLSMGYYFVKERSLENILSTAQCMQCINSMIGFISFILTIIIAVDYFENEPCGTLRIFVGVLLILWCVLFVLGFCICCVVIALAAVNQR